MGLRAFTKDILIPNRAVRLGALHGERKISVRVSLREEMNISVIVPSVARHWRNAHVREKFLA